MGNAPVNELLDERRAYDAKPDDGKVEDLLAIGFAHDGRGCACRKVGDSVLEMALGSYRRLDDDIASDRNDQIAAEALTTRRRRMLDGDIKRRFGRSFVGDSNLPRQVTGCIRKTLD